MSRPHLKRSQQLVFQGLPRLLLLQTLPERAHVRAAQHTLREASGVSGVWACSHAQLHAMPLGEPRGQGVPRCVPSTERTSTCSYAKDTSGPASPVVIKATASSSVGSGQVSASQRRPANEAQAAAAAARGALHGTGAGTCATAATDAIICCTDQATMSAGIHMRF